MAACRQLGFDVTGNSAIRSSDPEYPTPEPKMKCTSDHPLQRHGNSRIWNPILGGRGGRRGTSMAPFERAMVVSYRLSIVTVALSVTIRPQFAIECPRSSNQQWVGHFGPKFPGVPLMFGFAESEHPRLTNREIISKECQPM